MQKVYLLMYDWLRAIEVSATKNIDRGQPTSPKQPEYNPTPVWLLKASRLAEHFLRLCYDAGIVEGTPKPSALIADVSPLAVFDSLRELDHHLQHHRYSFLLWGWDQISSDEIRRYRHILDRAVAQAYQDLGFGELYNTPRERSVEIETAGGRYEAGVNLDLCQGSTVQLTWPFSSLSTATAEAFTLAATQLRRIATEQRTTQSINGQKASAAHTTKDRKKPSTEWTENILSAIRRSGRPLVPKEIKSQLGMKGDGNLYHYLQWLDKNGVIEKQEDGSYRIVDE